MPIDYFALGRRVRAWRRQYHMTQSELAEMAGLSLSFLGHIERGTRKASIETLVNIADALKTSPDNLLAHDVGYPTIHPADPQVVDSMRKSLSALQNDLNKLDTC